MKAILRIIMVLCFSVWVKQSLAEGTITPQGTSSVVDKMHAALIDVMKRGNELGYSGRFATLTPVISTSFDFPTVSKLVLGRYWKEIDDTKKNQFIDVFKRLSIATYASRFNSYDNEQFRNVSEEPLKDGVLVKTEIVKANGETVSLNYHLNQKDNQWLIINVVADGVSDLSLKRSDYTSIMKDKGFDALIVMLNDKITQYENKK